MNPPARRLERALRRRRVGVDVRAEDVDVGLRACAPACVPVIGDADAAAEIAHQVEQAGRVAHPLARNPIHADRRQRHEQRRQAEPLEELRPEDVPVAGVQVQLRRARSA